MRYAPRPPSRLFATRLLFLLSSLLTFDSFQPGDPVPKTTTTSSPSVGSSTTGGGFGLYSVVAVGGLIAYFAYQYLQAKEANQAQAA